MLDREVEVDQPPPTVIRSVNDAAVLIGELAHDEPVETLFAVLVNARHEILPEGIRVVSRGLLSSSQIHPREVFADAVHYRAYAVLVGHNHPSGNMTPSPDDLTAFDTLRRAGEILDIPLVDFIIVGPDGEFYSFVAGLGTEADSG